MPPPSTALLSRFFLAIAGLWAAAAVLAGLYGYGSWRTAGGFADAVDDAVVERDGLFEFSADAGCGSSADLLLDELEVVELDTTMAVGRVSLSGLRFSTATMRLPAAVTGPGPTGPMIEGRPSEDAAGESTVDAATESVGDGDGDETELAAGVDDHIEGEVVVDGMRSDGQWCIEQVAWEPDPEATPDR